MEKVLLKIVLLNNLLELMILRQSVQDIAVDIETLLPDGGLRQGCPCPCGQLYPIVHLGVVEPQKGQLYFIYYNTNKNCAILYNEY